THTSAEDNLTVATSLQAATAGVQDYQRVRIGTASDARIKEAAAADVVHLLTELVDNALSYSAPTTTVLLSSATAPEGVTVEIEDSGLGIPDRALADINETLEGGGEATPDTARRMGLFVVSRLAQKHGITVHLHHNRHHGTTAEVLLPTSILDAARLVEPAAPVEPAPPVEQTAPLPRRATTASEAGTPSLEERLNGALGLPRRQPGVPAEPEATPTVRTGAHAAADHAPPPTSATQDEFLDGLPTPAASPDSEDEVDTPIFEALRSAWLSANASEESWKSSEVEAGWERADRVAASLAEAPVNAAGLPMRRPGTRVVPGGVAKPAAATARDPEAVRARLAAHVAGVSRGRAAAATSPDLPPSEEAPHGRA
ncbi:MAG: ATP-binding protein, partial [Nocardioidaceae bacterium]